MPVVLNVGGGSKAIPIPSQFDGWDHLLLDIDPAAKADITCGAQEIKARLAPSQFDAVYCSHNLEHYYRHEVPTVLAGFLHVLKPGGFCFIRVPDAMRVIREVAQRGMDLTDVLYTSPAGPIMVMDVLWGFGHQIARSGDPFFAHKTGFSLNVLRSVLLDAGFTNVTVTVRDDLRELMARGHKGS